MLKRDSKGRFLPKSKGLGDDIQKGIQSYRN